jgi:two-component system sensor histidine kinase ChiS
VQQVIQNLIENSMKYSSETVNILVKAEKIDDKGVITIKDNGIGIAPEHLPVIFDRFYQIARPNTRKHHGAGLGLAISRELIELMGGSIAVESEIDTGTTFVITLSTTDAVLPETFLREHGHADAQDADVTGIPDHSPSERILVVDDDSFSSALLEKILNQDFIVTTAASGSEGLEMILDGSYDLILLDWMMPGMDGLSLLLAIKNIEEYMDIPVIFVSGKAEPDSMEEALKAGAAAFIAKPFSRAKLIYHIHRALGYESRVH